MKKHLANTPKNHRGISMVEVLVTLFVLSVGLLGVASLQFVSSLSSSEALARSQSVLVAQQFSERLRANAVMSIVGDGWVVDDAYFNADNYNFAGLSCPGGGLPYDCFCQEHPASVPNCQGANCSAAETAAFDAYQASCAAVSSNPNATLELVCDDNNVVDADACSAGSRHTIMVTWPAQSWQNQSRTLNPVCNEGSSTELDCVVLELTL